MPRGITPTYVAGFRAFLDLNRCVRKGEKAIRILAPVAVKQRDEHGEETGEKKVFFRTVPVFDVTDDRPPARQGARPAHAAVAADHRRQPPPPDRSAHRPRRASSATASRSATSPSTGPGGWCDPKRKQIVVATGPANRQVRTLVHEIAHAHGLGYEQYGREQAEVLVDCVTYSSARLGRARRRRRVDPVHRRLGRRRRARRDPRVRADDRHDRPPHRGRARPRARAGRATRSPPKRSRPDSADTRGSAGLLLAPMIGQARPADARRDSADADVRRPASPGSGLMQPPTEPARGRDHHGASPRGDEDELYRRHHRDLSAPSRTSSTPPAS